MNKKVTPEPKPRGNEDERGAALIMTLLISTLMLAAGGALIAATSMSVSNAVDVTSEKQAYYAAEAGLQATLEVLRNNREATPALASGEKFSFRKAVVLITSNDSAGGDTSSEPRLSRWLPYSNRTVPGTRVNIGIDVAYDVLLSDPAYSSYAALSTALGDPNYVPPRLLVTVNGYGPRGARKQLRMLVSRFAIELDPPGPIVIRGADDGVSPMTFNLGNSSPRRYIGGDIDNPSAPAGPTIVTSYHDRDTAICGINGGPQVSDPKLAILNYNSTQRGGTAFNADVPSIATCGTSVTTAIQPSRTPSFMESADAARALLNEMEAIARAEGRYFTSYDGTSGVPPTTSNPAGEPAFTFVDGNCTLYGGAGLIVVTGTLTLNGNDGFNGVLLVLGGGTVTRQGGGGGNTFGSFMVARFNRTSGNFLAPFFDVSGGGNADIQFSSSATRRANLIPSRRVLGIYEN
jgi:hypothetical protein